MRVLVTGGAGYVGSHTCLALSKRGYVPVVLDDLSNGHREFVQWGPFEEGSINDPERLEEVFAKYEPSAIVHFAGLIEVNQSTRDPVLFYQHNVGGAINVVATAVRHGKIPIVFSSTCATYGNPKTVPIGERHAQRPISPYGRSKLMVEHILCDADSAYSLRSVRLRYFNAAGADPKGRIGERHDPETHVVPLAIEAALNRDKGFAIFGTDYDTRDGTCIRDYVHVMDLAEAHVLAVNHLLGGGQSTSVNLGTGRGTTVRELVQEVSRVIGRPVQFEERQRRAGDPAVLVADNRQAERVLGWSPSLDLHDVVRDAYAWHQSASKDRAA